MMRSLLVVLLFMPLLSCTIQEGDYYDDAYTYRQPPRAQVETPYDYPEDYDRSYHRHHHHHHRHHHGVPPNVPHVEVNPAPAPVVPDTHHGHDNAQQPYVEKHGHDMKQEMMIQRQKISQGA